MPKWNWNPSKVVWMDLETQSALNLKSVGARTYLRHSTTRIMSAVFQWTECGTLFTRTWIPTGRCPASFPDDQHTWISATLPDFLCDLVHEGYTFVAHNAEAFDSLAWELLLPDAPQPEWFDTIHLCRANGLPAGLDRACKALGIQGKDAKGADALKLLYTVKMVRGRPVYPVGTVPLWQSMLRYNVQDVIALRELHLALGKPHEPGVLRVNSAINERGCPVDLRFAAVLKELWKQHQEEEKKHVAKATDGELSEDDIRSPAKVKKWLASHGLVIPSLERKQVEAMMNDPDGFFGPTADPNVALVTEVIKARASAVRATAGKIERVFNVTDSDSRVRGMFVYHGAHTGRWSGRDLQLHNFPRGVKFDIGRALALYQSDSLGLAAVHDISRAANQSVGDVLATLMRPVIRAPEGKTFVIYDYASVEARGIAWIAGEDGLLEVFRDPKGDPYKRMASILFGVEPDQVNEGQRFVGKQIVLGCGYGMGAPKFGAMCRLFKVDLAKEGVTPEQCVKVYREGHPNIQRCWRNLHKAAHRVVAGGSSEFIHRCIFSHDGKDFRITLPSKRQLVYRNASIQPRPPKWDLGARPVDTLVYSNPHGVEKILYGGLLAENIVQAMCRDFLADAIVRLESRGHEIVSHVHDEILVECPEKRAPYRLIGIGEEMSKEPEWAPGFPMRAEGFVSEHYIKGGIKGCLRGDFINGVSIDAVLHV